MLDEREMLEGLPKLSAKRPGSGKRRAKVLLSPTSLSKYLGVF
jgi:hypothetical protein